VGETLELEAWLQDRAETVDFVCCDRQIQIEADQGFHVGVHGLTADHAVSDPSLGEQGDEAIENARLIHGHGLPEIESTQGATPRTP
jgi:hypothetical protein